MLFELSSCVLLLAASVAGASPELVPGIDVHDVESAWDDHVAEVGIHARELSKAKGTPVLLAASNPNASDADLQSYRKAIFTERFNRFAEHNQLFTAGKVSYRQVLNKFADLSLDELKTYIGGKGFVGRPVDAELPEGAEVVLPKATPKQSDEEIDWRSDDLPVHNQGNCGSCWAFASATMIENRLYHAGYGYIPVAQQEMVDCVEDCWGCNGGWSFYATEYVAKNGIASSASYAYSATDQTCAAGNYRRAVKAGALEAQYARAKGEEYLPSILSSGPVTIAFWVNEDFYYLNGEDVYSPQKKCNMKKSLGGHAVTLVGMQDDHWILQNSWGESWGDDGFFRMARGENACKIGTVDNWSWISLPNQQQFPEVDALIEEALELGLDGEFGNGGEEEPLDDEDPLDEPEGGSGGDGLSPGLIVLCVAGGLAAFLFVVIPAGIWWSKRLSLTRREERYNQLVKNYGGTSAAGGHAEGSAALTKSGADPSSSSGASRLEYYKEPVTALEMKRTNLSV